MNKQHATPLAGILSLILSLQPTAAVAVMATSVEAPTGPTSEIELAQRRGGGGGSRGGRSRGGGGSRGGGSRAGGSRSSGARSSRGSGGRTGFSSYSGSGSRTAGANRSGSRSSTRQSTRQSNQGTRQTNRQSTRSTRQSNQGSRQTNRQGTRNTRQTDRNNAINTRQDGRSNRTNTRQNNRTDRVNTRNDSYRKAANNWDRYGRGWYSNNGWSNNRPWNHGWYGGSTWNNWGWYPGRAAAWGLASMATFGVINNLVNSAQSNEVSYIVVPDSDYSLYYPSVTASGDVITFEADNGYDTVRYSANCQQGSLNGGSPQDANEAQLLNAACQVAFGQ
ncbi:hypothetical protein [Synechococcus sp. MIT S9451]|uniref:hypothetical protein n=1 Tax=Synechococcus sp. MIT S9451 TaxID=3082543 RepID=UPI0039B45C33